MRRRSNTAFKAALFPVFTLVCFGVWFFVFYTKIGQDRYIIVERNNTFYSISRDLYRGDNLYSGLMRKLFFLTGKTWLVLHKKKLQIGEYEIKATDSLFRIVRKIASGRIVYHQIVFPEGITTQNMIHIIRNNNILIGNIPADITEGTLMPETYNITRFEERAHLIARMQRAMNDFLKEEWIRRDPNLPIKTPYQALILASIVEKEVGAGDCGAMEYKNIASVFTNRLHKRMRLQSDPTVFYSINVEEMQHGDVNSIRRRPTFKELEISHPYNTYRINGLPPTPICNPSKKAIESVLHPAKTDFLFFIGDDRKCHIFAKNFDEHKVNRKNRSMRRLSAYKAVK